MTISKTSVIVILLKLAGKLPLGVAQAIGRFLGRLGWWLPTNAKTVTKTNLAICFPELDAKAQRALGKASLRHTGETIMEIPLIWEWPVEKCLSLVKEIEGEHLLQNAMNSGKGLILLAPHLGNWELAGLYFSSRYQMAALYSPPHMPEFEDYMINVRGRLGSELVRGDRRGLSRLMTLLREGGVAGILPDQSPRGAGNAYAPFFGMEVRTMTLVSKLAQKSGSNVLATYAERLPDGQGFRIVVRDAEAGIDDPEPVIATTALNKTVETCVRALPEQYQWEYKRLRHRPPGQPNPYYPDRICR
ncbi:lysophospholipid acyltransferase family protein [Marinobacter sp. BGYM27]|uniref:lysophospholipid acyltransferase family protein n=1 Tax=Marinobacter sp. BGYM27 TaxID=2975597 RepID=UPI0021A5DA9F|nr:lysophospholipid acyltransferase family protein [Marinobacter sp. BGYM27]MDG5501335.1 lysophospholipid acyltransferase family protein [Marinobacter sp. BGYM27]